MTMVAMQEDVGKAAVIHRAIFSALERYADKLEGKEKLPEPAQDDLESTAITDVSEDEANQLYERFKKLDSMFPTRVRLTAYQ
ncbi:hypothetical protein BH11PAT2_BH11PAT2_09830 [soil metagenome]